MQGAVYCTYISNGTLKRGVLSQTQYLKYSQDSSIQNLKVYATQGLMESGYMQEKGVSGHPKTMLFS